ncbi:MAG: RidA family protein [Chloroflexi bacterium]|nr:RidA family protein [Chloroflexota bacterium]MBI5053191.1 RidA family protein [Chloroflexota bacterium]MBI5348336.1 RidA family protein [Chloroflexota bacterium]
MNKTVVSTDKAPKAIGPYSQAIKVGEFVYTAGQIAIDPATGEIVGGGIEAQTRRVLQNLTEVLKAAGSSMDKVIKTTVFMVNLAEFNKMNAVYTEFFPKDPPARSTVQVAALPKMGVVEIEVVALV